MHELLVRGGKLVVVIAAIWAVGVSLYIFHLPVSMHGISGVIFSNSGAVVEAVTKEQSWYETHGLWGLLWLVIFSGIYLVAIRIAWSGNYTGLLIVGVIATTLSVITGFSIGGAYLPAGIGVLTGSLMFLSSRMVISEC